MARWCRYLAPSEALALWGISDRLVLPEGETDLLGGDGTVL